jgi:flagella basal body P-ring formation protein FlgA
MLVMAAVLMPGLEAAAAKGVRVPVPRQVIYPGEIVSAELFGAKTFRKSYVMRIGAVVKPDQLAGMVARRTLLPGKPVPRRALRRAYHVERGRPVRLEFRSGALTITTMATALQSGVRGDIIQVRNLDSGLQVAGQVQADGSVAVVEP